MVDGERIQDIMLAVDVGYDINHVATGYVEQFNKVSHFTIVEWSTRNPTDKEIKHAKEFQTLNGVDKVFKKGDEWFTEIKGLRKRVFVLLVGRYQKVAPHLYESRMKNLKVESLEIHRAVSVEGKDK